MLTWLLAIKLSLADVSRLEQGLGMAAQRAHVRVSIHC